MSKHTIHTVKCAATFTAIKMTRLAYNNVRGWTLPSDENGSDIGYFLTRSSNHQSWVPEYVFLNDYEVIS